MATENLVLVLLGIGFAVGGALVGLLGRAQRLRYRRWADAGTEAQGTVVDVREYYSGGSVRREPLVEYCDRDGAKHRAFGQSNRGLLLEASVRLVYDPNDPESVLLAWDVERSCKVVRALTVVFAALGAGLIALGLS